MLIQKIELQNFGAFLGKHEIDLSLNGGKKPVILFGGLNGSGKTTFLESMNVALYGKNAPRIRGGNGSYERYLKGLIHRNANPEEDTFINLQFRTQEDGKEKEISVQRSWSAKNKNIQDKLSVFVDGEFESNISENWSTLVERYIPARLSNLFFFDGERIENLADPDKSREMVKTAIYSLLGIDLIEQLKADLTFLDRSKKKLVQDKETIIIIERLEKEIEESNQIIQKKKQEKASLQNDFEQTIKRINTLEEEYIRAGGEMLDSRKDLEEEEKSLEKKLEEKSEDLINFSSGPLPLLMVEPLIKNIFQQDQLEENASNSKIFFNFIKERDRKLLSFLEGKKIDLESLKEFEDFLNQDNESMEENQKIEIYLSMDSSTRNSTHKLLYGVLESELSYGQKLHKEYIELSMDKDLISEKIASIPEKAALQNITEGREKAFAEKQEIEEKMVFIEEEIKKNVAVRELKGLELEKHLKISKEMELENQDSIRFLDHSGRVQKTMNKFRARILERNIEKLENFILEGYLALLRKDGMIQNLKIDTDNCELTFLDKKGHEIDPQRLSAGERQLLAVSVLWGLAKASGRPMPVVIDTPLGRLDSHHRSHLIDRYFPFASHQVFLLSTDEEIDLKNYGRLKQWVAKSYQFEFNDNTGSSSVRAGYFFGEKND